MRARLALATIAAGLLVAVAPASAQDSLQAGDVDASQHPALEVVVTSPGGAADPAGFTVTEAGTPVPLTVEALAGSDLQLVLAIDTSGSMGGGALASARAAAREFVGVLPPQVRIAVIGFGPTPTLATPLTADRAVVGAAIDGLTAGGETAMYDAIVAAGLSLDSTEARSALVVLSDGGDTVSTASLDQAAAVAADFFDVVHAISLVSPEQDSAALGRIVSGGGSVVEAVDQEALSSVYRDVATRIVSQYALRWESTLTADGPVEIAYSDGTTVFSATRSVDLADDVVAPPATTPEVDATPEPTTPPQKKFVPSPTARSEPEVVSAPGSVGGWVMAIGVLFLAAALFGGGLALFGPRTRTRRLAKEIRSRVPTGRELSSASRRLVDAVEHLLRRDPERHSGLALRLERAGLDWTPAEFGAVLVAGGAILALLGFAFGGLLFFVLLPVVGVFAALALVDGRAAKRSKLFTAQLDGTLQLIAGSLRSGFGIMQALGTVAEETEWPTAEEFTRVLGEARLGRDLDDALDASALRIDSEDYYWVVEAIQISREVGGNLAEVLDNISGTIRQRNTLRRQVRSLSAEGRLSAVILLALPFLMLVWMKITNPEYIGLLFSRTGGQIAVVVGSVLMVVGALWMRKIVRVRF